MKISEIQKSVDTLAQALVFVDWDDLDSMAELPEKFGDLGALLREAGLETEADHCSQAASVAGQVLNESVSVESGQDFLTMTLNALQSCLQENCSCQDADWPDAMAVSPVSEVNSDDPAPEAETNKEAPPLVDESIMAEFLARQTDVLDDIEKELLAVEAGETAGDSEGINRFFHTLKGESALLGLHDVADVCHATEDIIQAEGIKACIDRLLAVKDWFVGSFRHLRGEGSAPDSVAAIKEILSVASDSVGQDQPVPTETKKDVPETGAVSEAIYQVVDYSQMNVLEGDLDLVQDFVEEAVEHLDASEAHLLAIEADAKETEALNAVFRGFHTIKGLAGFIEMEHIKDLAHKAENLLDMARRDELDLVGNNMDLVFESVDMMKRLVEGLAAAMGGNGKLSQEDDMPLLMTRLVAATSADGAPIPVAVVEPEPEPEPITPEDDGSVAISGFVPLGKMKKKTPPVQPVAAAEAAPEKTEVKAPTAAAEPADKPAKANAPTKMKEAMRVDAERLDHLIETIGELVIAESMVSQSPEVKSMSMSVKLAKDLDHLDKICRELQEIGMSLRMVPVRPVFQKMARLVRDLSKKQNRQVDFVMTGEDTELDKNVVDKIGDPLVHMVRNSVDHGIESDPADRVKLGKSERGRVELRAFHKGGNICIEIEDDGRGLNKDAIKEKAITRGLLREGDVISDRDLFMLIFEPGFSTAKEVTDISGRGVGMDVVRRNIEDLRGTVDITSEKGKGSTFSIKLPLTLAIIEGMVIKVGIEHYIVPTLSVVRLIRPREEDLTHVFDKGEMLAFEGNHLPLFRLSRLFDVEEAKSGLDEAMVVVVEDEGRKIGLMADQLLGQQSIVIKNLGEAVQGTDGVAGGAIMSDGNVALILDIAGLVRVAHAVDVTVVREDQRSSQSPASASVDKMIETIVAEEKIVDTDLNEPLQPATGPDVVKV